MDTMANANLDSNLDAYATAKSRLSVGSGEAARLAIATDYSLFYSRWQFVALA